MRVLTFLACLTLLGCGEADNATQAADSADAVDRPTVFDPLTGTLDRAEGVEDTLAASAAERRRQLEEAEGR